MIFFPKCFHQEEVEGLEGHDVILEPKRRWIIYGPVFFTYYLWSMKGWTLRCPKLELSRSGQTDRRQEPRKQVGKYLLHFWNFWQAVTPTLKMTDSYTCGILFCTYKWRNSLRKILAWSLKARSVWKKINLETRSIPKNIQTFRKLDGNPSKYCNNFDQIFTKRTGF